jgi:RNA polymerase primary sigma factor
MFDETVSLDEIDPDTGLSGADLLLDPEARDSAEIAEHASLRSTLLGVLEDLDERSREVIVLRFGLGGEDAMTLEEVGQCFGVTRERIRQIEAKTLRKLRHPSRSNKLKSFLE